VIEPSGGVLFRILGPVEAWTGQDWAKITAAKQRSLLATLLVHAGQPVSTDVLAEEVWRGEPPAKPSSLLSVYMYHLRRLIGDTDGRVLSTRPPGYQVVLGRGGLDADQFTRLVAMGRQALADGAPSRAVDLLTEALDLWRGRALADVFPTQLIEAEARRLEESRVEALELRAEASLACGRNAEVIPELRRLLADQPMREKLWALLMRALYGAGRQAEALEVYDEARRKIADELGVDPGPELRQLHQQILDADSDQTLLILGSPGAGQAPAAPYQPPMQLPADITDFTGRTGQVNRLRGLLTDTGADSTPGAVRVALVVGAGGLGKTTLAVHAAHLLASEFPDGQLYANLHGAAQPTDPAEVLARFLRALGAEPANIPLGEEERSAHYRTRLAGKRVLIVLDDARDAAQVRPLLPGSASCAVLVTARRRLPELAGTKVLDLDVLPLDEARTLFVLVAGQERTVAEPAATDDVLAACAGLPLAIRIGGARLAARGNWTVRTLADRLADERRRLDELRAGNLAVRASFEVSFASLPGPELADGVDPARAFRLLGLWTGSSVSLVAASALLGEEEYAVADALDVLVDAHLLETRALDQYRFHDLLRVYAADRARTQETEQDRQAAVSRVLSWYLHTTAAAAEVISPQHTKVPLEPPPQTVHPLSFTSFEEALAWCEAERAGLTAATRLAATYGLDEFAWKLPAAAMSFYFRRSYWTDWITAHDVGLSSARALHDPLAQAWMFNNLGMAYGQQQRMPEAVSYFEQALELYRHTEDLRGVARAEYNLANASFDLGRYAEALEAAERSLAIQRQLGNRYVEGLALETMGCACRELGRSAEAVDHFQQAMAIFRDLGDEDSEADVLSDLGEAYLGLRRFDEAIAYLEQSLTIRRNLKDRAGQAATLARLGHAHHGAGDLEQAREFLAEAQRLSEELGDHDKAAEVHAALADITNEDD
jgi:DNA-binding SARP family transcriptional activator/Tfp pilus assembly protein PilF